MKKHFLSFICGAVLTALIFALSISTLAASGRMSIEVDPVNIMVDGSVFSPTDANGNAVPVFAYNGTTYAPLRALAEAFGLNVGYDAAANMAVVTKPGAEAPTVTPTTDTTQANIWETRTYVDKFNESTSAWYIIPRRDIDGTFSNSAATNSELKASVVCDVYDDISIFLYEYGSIQVKNYSSSKNDDYVITVRCSNGREAIIYGSIYPLGDRLFVDEEDVPLMIEMLKEPGTVSFHIEELDPLGIPTTYLFSVETGDFAAEYQAAKEGK